MFALPILLAVFQAGSHADLHPGTADLFVEFPGLTGLREPYQATALAQLASDPVLKAIASGQPVPADGGSAGPADWRWLEDLVDEGLAQAPIPDEMRAAIKVVWAGLDGLSFSVSGLGGTLEHRATHAARVSATFEGLGLLEREIAFYASPAKWGSHPDALGELPDLSTDALADAWGNAWVYERTGEQSYRLLSLGADGAPGGVGASADIELGQVLDQSLASVIMEGVRLRTVLAFADDGSTETALGLLQAAGAESAGAPNVWLLPLEEEPAPHVRVERQERRLVFDVSIVPLPPVADSLAKNAEYLAARAHLEAPGATVWQGYWRMSPAEIASMLPEAELDFDRAPLLALAADLFGTTPEASVWRTGVQPDGRFVKESFSATGSDGSGMARWLRHAPVSDKVRGWIPPDTIGFYAATMDPGFVFDRTVEAASATLGMSRDDLMSLAESSTGVPIDEELVSSLGESFGVCFDLAGLGPPKLRVYAELADPAAFAESFGALWDAGALLVDKDVAKMSRRTYRKVDLFTVSAGGGGIGMPQPTFAILGDRLFFTLSSSHAKKEVKRLNSEDEAGPQHPALAASALAGGHSLLYMDWGALIGGVYELGKTFGSMFGVWEQIGVDSADLPETARITAPFSPTVGYSVPVAGGLYGKRESSLGPELAVLPVAAGAGAMVAASSQEDRVIETTLPPKPPAEVAAGPVEATKATLRRLKTDLKIYELQHGAFPERLDDLTQPSTDYPEGILAGGTLPTDAWQRSYRYERLESGYRLYSTGPDGVDQAGGGDDILAP